MQANRVLNFVSLWLIGSLLLGACGPDQSGEPTRVYLVRHAEKDMTDPSAKNPPLTPAGVTRAQHLAQKFGSVRFDAIYSTDFERSRNTVKPVADAQKTRVTTYEWHDYAGVQQLLEKNKGKTLLLCGHGDNILPIIKNAGAKPPMDSLGTNEYDKLFKLLIRPDGTAEATVETFN